MKKKTLLCYVMLCVTALLVAGAFVYMSYFSTTEAQLRADKKLITLNGPWKFIPGDSIQYAAPGYNDAQWQNISLAAPPGVHDGDVGLSGYIPGWTANGHPTYAGYAWYRLTISRDSVPAGNIALAAPPAVDDAYQLFINGKLMGSEGDFTGTVPKAYSIHPRMFTVPENAANERNITVAFRVWMSPASLGDGAGGIHIAPTLGDTKSIEKQYRFQWEQSIKGYIVEVVWPLIFILLAITLFVLSRGSTPPQPCKWLIAALVLLGLMRLNQATTAWLYIETNNQATIIGTVILKPLVLGSWLMAWREWFCLHKPKWLPAIIATLTILFMAAQLLSLSWVAPSLHTYFQTIAGYVRLLLLALMLAVLYLGMRKQGTAAIWVLIAALIMLIALFPQEISALHIIPGIWFPYGVGVTRGQFFYVAFVFVMYGVLIGRNSKSL